MVKFVSLCLLAVVSLGLATDICQEPACQCTPNAGDPELIDATCNCDDKQILNIGPSNGNGGEGKAKHNAVSLPPAAAQLAITGCHHVEVFSRALNHLPQLKNISINDTHKVVLHKRLYESRAGNGGNIHLHAFNIEKVRELKVSGQAFEGTSVDGSFVLKEVTMQRVEPLSFNFDAVGEFNIFGSIFERVPMWGFKLRSCREFNILEKSRFLSLASGAFHLTCNKFMLAYSKFGALQDSSLNVRFGVCDIQGNYFETLVNKPFNALQKMSSDEMVSAGIADEQVAFIFRENQFASQPALAVNSLDLPAYKTLSANPAHQIVIEDNHFVCQCGRMDWFIGAIKYGFDIDNITSIEFLRKLHDSAARCLECSISSCQLSEKTFAEFSSKVHLDRTINGPLKCSTSRPQPESTAATRLPVQKPEESRVVMTGNSDLIRPSALIPSLIFLFLRYFQ